MQVITRGEIATEIKDGLYFIFTDEIKKPGADNTTTENIKALSELDPRSQKRLLDELITRHVIGINLDTDSLTTVTVKGKTRLIQVLMTPEVAETLNELNELGARGEIIIT